MNRIKNSANNTLDRELRGVLDQRQKNHLSRWRRIVDSAQSVHLKCQGQSYLSFCSNNYLGLANHPAVITQLKNAATQVGVGSGASHLVSGHNYYHQQLEEALAEFTGRQRALLFSTGYMANLGVITALMGRNDTLFQDRLNHASLIDAGILSRAHFKRFQHNNTRQLGQQLNQSSNRPLNQPLNQRRRQQASGRKLVVVDGVFSMDGDLAPLPALASLCQQHNAHLMVDDAHGFGVLGQQGGGCAEHFQLSPSELPILVGTLSKAFGTFGAFVVGSNTLIETLIQFARPYIYTTALPPAVAAATLTSLTLVQQGHKRREQLQQRITQFQKGAQQLGLQRMVSSTPIQPLILGQDDLVLTTAEKLYQDGILVGAIRPPTVPEGTARLRITLSSEHSENDINRLLSALEKAIPEHSKQGVNHANG